MNIAVCISGQNRPKNFNYNLLKIFKNYSNMDVFIHMWSKESNLELIDYLQPKKYIFESQKNFYDESYIFSKPLIKCFYNKLINNLEYFNSSEINWTWQISENKNLSKAIIFGQNNMDHFKNDLNGIYIDKNIIEFAYRVHSMFYSILLSNKLKNNFERSNNVKYDLVVRLRLDCIIENEIDLSCLSSNYLHTIRWSRIMNDAFAISNKEYMDAYCDTFFNLNDLLFDSYNNKEIKNLCPEALLYQSLKNQNIPHKIIDNISMRLIK